MQKIRGDCLVLVVLVTIIATYGLANAETRDFARATPHSAAADKRD